MKTATKVIACCILLGTASVMSGQTLQILKGQTKIEKVFADSITTSADEGAGKPLTLYVEYDAKKKSTYLRGDTMILNGAFTACKRQVILFAVSFNTSKATFKVGQTSVRSNGQMALVGDQKILGIQWDGASANLLKDTDSVRQAQ